MLLLDTNFALYNICILQIGSNLVAQFSFVLKSAWIGEKKQ